MLFITAAHTFPLPRNEKMSQPIFLGVTVFIAADIPTLLYRVSDYGQNQSARGQPWTEPTKTHHLITSLSISSRHRPIRARHFPDRPGDRMMEVCFDGPWLPIYY